MKKNNQYIYRFRSLENFFKYKELDNQIIFFQNIEFQNDIFECYIDYYWSGDKILWHNFFKNYIKSLYLILMFIHKEKPLCIDDINIRAYNDLKKDNISTYILNLVCKDVFNDKKILHILNYLSLDFKKIKKDELLLYLSTLNIYFICKIISNIIKLFPGKISKYKLFKNFNLEYDDNLIDKLINNKELQKLIDQNKNIMINYKYIYKTLKNFNIIYILYVFPLDYIKKIQTITYPQCYISCFTKSYKNNSMWGNYANKHKGICLIFKYQQNKNKKYLCLKNFENIDYCNERLYKINYKNKIPSISFFENIGMTTINERYEWFYLNKELSEDISIRNRMKNINEWRKKYYNLFKKCILRKDLSWSKEEEYRIWQVDPTNDFKNNKEYQNFHYKFSDLAGIIFGKEIDEANKQKIINIIKEKLKIDKNKDFKFYQAYDFSENGLEICELTLLNQNLCNS